MSKTAKQLNMETKEVLNALQTALENDSIVSRFKMNRARLRLKKALEKEAVK